MVVVLRLQETHSLLQALHIRRVCIGTVGRIEGQQIVLEVEEDAFLLDFCSLESLKDSHSIFLTRISEEHMVPLSTLLHCTGVLVALKLRLNEDRV